MFLYFESLIKFVVFWILSFLFSVIACIRLLFVYIKHFTSMPWKPKDRILMEPPHCLSDPKYGTHKYVTINKVRIHYVESGDKSKPLMIFVHGFPEFWYSWRHQIVEFSKDYWVIAIDLRGFNKSDKPRGSHNYKIDQLVSDLKVFIEFLNRKQCILICHDWGAFIGWHFVAEHRHMVYKYIMLGCPPLQVFHELTLNRMDQFKKSWNLFFFKMPILPELLLSANDFGSFFNMWNNKFSDNFTEDDLETYKYVYSKTGALTAGINYYRANSSFTSFAKLKKDDGSNGMFILGQRDVFISHAACIVMATDCPQLRVEVIPNANHFVHQDAPNKINALLHDFLGSAAMYTIDTLR